MIGPVHRIAAELESTDGTGHRARRLAIAISGPSDGIGTLVSDGMRALGVEVVEWTVGHPMPAAHAFDELVIPGPTVDLAMLRASLPRRLVDWPRMSIWLTEQLPDPDANRFWRRASLAAAALVPEIAARLPSIALRRTRVRSIFSRGARWQVASLALRLHDAGKLALLATQTPSHAAYFRSILGVPARVVPYGYHPTLGQDLGLSRDVDAVFLGSLRDQRRRQIMASVRRECAHRGVDLQVFDGGENGPLLFGQERAALLNRSRVMLSIMRQPWDDLVFRMLLAAPNGAVVVSEPVVDDVPFETGRHFVSASVDSLPEAVHAICRDERRRSELAAAARQRVVDQMPMERMCQEFLRGHRSPLALES